MSDDLPAVPGPSEVRISDSERDRTVGFLREHCADGRLTLDEFSDRVGLVFEARTAGELERLTADLPELATAPVAESPATRSRRVVRWTVSVMSGSRRRGRWRIERETNALAFMGGCHLDLREAEVVGPEAVINAFAFMGGIEVVVPEGIEVALEGFAFMGGKHARIRDVPVIPGSPLIRVRAFAFMGGVDVRSKSDRGDQPRRVRSSRQAIPPAPGAGGAGGRDARDRTRARRDDRRDDRRARRGSRHDERFSAPPGAAPGLLRAGIEAVADDVREDWPALRAQVAPEGTVTIMFSDVEGFTPLCERVGDHRASELLQAHYRLVRDELARHGGYEVKVHGDGFMVAFSSASRALRCAIAIQRSQQAWNERHPDEPMRVRMGLHTGEAIRDADDFLGTTVNLASRIASEAGGDEVLVSALLRELCASSGEFTFDAGTELELKGISQPQRVHAVLY